MRPVIDKAELKQIIGELRRFAKGTDLLDDLEREHRWEIEQDRQREQSLRLLGPVSRPRPWWEDGTVRDRP